MVFSDVGNTWVMFTVQFMSTVFTFTPDIVCIIIICYTFRSTIVIFNTRFRHAFLIPVTFMLRYSSKHVLNVTFTFKTIITVFYTRWDMVFTAAHDIFTKFNIAHVTLRNITTLDMLGVTFTPLTFTASFPHFSAIKLTFITFLAVPEATEKIITFPGAFLDTFTDKLIFTFYFLTFLSFILVPCAVIITFSFS